MPALLTAFVVVCAVSTTPDTVPTSCVAKVYHGIYAEPAACNKLSQESAMDWENSVVSNVPNIASTQSFAECAPKAQDNIMLKALPLFIETKMGGDANPLIIHYDIKNGKVTERKPTVQGRRT